MQCRQVGNRIEITPDLNLLTIKSNNQFIRTLDDPRYHGFDTPARKVWTVSDTPEAREALRGRGHVVVSSDRDCADIEADLDRFMESLDFTDLI